uniref:Uncharacterized protein n=1 Tax=Anguilla anguilla TaxID=7936 RepID=A0A0E9R741_ANGAN
MIVFPLYACSSRQIQGSGTGSVVGTAKADSEKVSHFVWDNFDAPETFALVGIRILSQYKQDNALKPLKE